MALQLDPRRRSRRNRCSGAREQHGAPREPPTVLDSFAHILTEGGTSGIFHHHTNMLLRHRLTHCEPLISARVATSGLLRCAVVIGTVIAVLIPTQLAAESTTSAAVVAMDDRQLMYHLPGCPLYKDFSHRAFESAAIAQGYRLHLGCATNRPRRPVSWSPIGSWDEAAIHVLFIGNSLTYFNEMPWMLTVLAKSRGLALQAFFVGRSGATLENLWRENEALFRIREKRWDYVVLQDQSLAPILHPHELSVYAKRFRDVILRAGAQPLLFVTWAHSDQWALQSQYDRTYLSLAESLRISAVPVGIAWERVKRINPEFQLHDGSTMHPNLAGSYLTACVFFAVITGHSPVGLPHTFDLPFTTHEFYRESLMNDVLEDGTARFLQDNARVVVEKLQGHVLYADEQ